MFAHIFSISGGRDTGWDDTAIDIFGGVVSTVAPPLAISYLGVSADLFGAGVYMCAGSTCSGGMGKTDACGKCK
jgi:hypothetical protein